jgi:hypothetical protein
MQIVFVHVHNYNKSLFKTVSKYRERSLKETVTDGEWKQRMMTRYVECDHFGHDQ